MVVDRAEFFVRPREPRAEVQFVVLSAQNGISPALVYTGCAYRLLIGIPV